MAGNAVDRWLTTNRAGYLVGALLVGAAVLGNLEYRTIPADDISLDALPSQIGEWSTDSEEVLMQPDGSYKTLSRTYVTEDGREAFVVVQATRTRLGSLRDWSLAAMAGGWTGTEETVWHDPAAPMDARIERLVNKSSVRIALTWYTSSASQSASLKKAEMFGARDRLLGGKKPWASLYIVAASGDEQADRATVEQLATGLAPSLREMMNDQS